MRLTGCPLTLPWHRAHTGNRENLFDNVIECGGGTVLRARDKSRMRFSGTQCADRADRIDREHETQLRSRVLTATLYRDPRVRIDAICWDESFGGRISMAPIIRRCYKRWPGAQVAGGTIAKRGSMGGFARLDP